MMRKRAGVKMNGLMISQVESVEERILSLLQGGEVAQSRFLANKGWSLLHNWITHTHVSENTALLHSILDLIQKLPLAQIEAMLDDEQTPIIKALEGIIEDVNARNKGEAGGMDEKTKMLCFQLLSEWQRIIQDKQMKAEDKEVDEKCFSGSDSDEEVDEVEVEPKPDPLRDPETTASPKGKRIVLKQAKDKECWTMIVNDKKMKSVKLNEDFLKEFLEQPSSDEDEDETVNANQTAREPEAGLETKPLSAKRNPRQGDKGKPVRISISSNSCDEEEEDVKIEVKPRAAIASASNSKSSTSPRPKRKYTKRRKRRTRKELEEALKEDLKLEKKLERAILQQKKRVEERVDIGNENPDGDGGSYLFRKRRSRLSSSDDVEEAVSVSTGIVDRTNDDDKTGISLLKNENEGGQGARRRNKAKVYVSEKSRMESIVKEMEEKPTPGNSKKMVARIAPTPTLQECEAATAKRLEKLSNPTEKSKSIPNSAKRGSNAPSTKPTSKPVPKAEEVEPTVDPVSNAAMPPPKQPPPPTTKFFGPPRASRTPLPSTSSMFGPLNPSRAPLPSTSDMFGPTMPYRAPYPPTERNIDSNFSRGALLPTPSYSYNAVASRTPLQLPGIFAANQYLLSDRFPTPSRYYNPTASRAPSSSTARFQSPRPTAMAGKNATGGASRRNPGYNVPPLRRLPPSNTNGRNSTAPPTYNFGARVPPAQISPPPSNQLVVACPSQPAKVQVEATTQTSSSSNQIAIPAHMLRKTQEMDRQNLENQEPPPWKLYKILLPRQHSRRKKRNHHSRRLRRHRSRSYSRSRSRGRRHRRSRSHRRRHRRSSSRRRGRNRFRSRSSSSSSSSSSRDRSRSHSGHRQRRRSINEETFAQGNLQLGVSTDSPSEPSRECDRHPTRPITAVITLCPVDNVEGCTKIFNYGHGWWPASKPDNGNRVEINCVHNFGTRRNLKKSITFVDLTLSPERPEDSDQTIYNFTRRNFPALPAPPIVPPPMPPVFPSPRLVPYGDDVKPPIPVIELPDSPEPPPPGDEPQEVYPSNNTTLPQTSPVPFTRRSLNSLPSEDVSISTPSSPQPQPVTPKEEPSLATSLITRPQVPVAMVPPPPPLSPTFQYSSTDRSYLPAMRAAFPHLFGSPPLPSEFSRWTLGNYNIGTTTYNHLSSAQENQGQNFGYSEN